MSSATETSGSIGARLRKSKPVSLPEEFLDWLGGTYGLQPVTAGEYARKLGQFLKYARLVDPERKPTLGLVWDAQLVNQFFKLLPELYSTGTVPNYCHPIVAARKYVSIELNEDPANAMKLTESFRMMTNVAQSKKTRHYATERFRFKHESQTMPKFHKNFYIGPGWKWYFKLGMKAKEAMLENKEFKLTRKQMARVNKYGLGVCAGTNYKRLGNYSLIKFKPAFKAICSSLEKFRKAHPKDHKITKQSAARVDRKKLAPTVLFIEESMKSYAPDHIVLINPRDVYALKIYAKYFRPNCPTPPVDDTFFVNGRGKKISPTDASHLFTSLGKQLNIPNLTVNALRRSAETENLRDSADEDVPLEYRVGVAAATTKFIGHSTETAMKSYSERNKTTSIQIVNRLLFFMEELGQTAQTDDELPAHDESPAHDELPVHDELPSDELPPDEFMASNGEGAKKKKGKGSKRTVAETKTKESSDEWMPDEVRLFNTFAAHFVSS